MKSVKQCDVCGAEICVDRYGYGKCKNCGWINDDNCIEFPNSVNPPNFVSLNKAKELYKTNKPFLPTYNEMLLLVQRGLDLSFVYKKHRYQLDLHDKFTLWKVDTEEYQEYDNFEDLANNLKIDNVFVKNIWDKIKFLRYEC